jgi:hypothetical protein
MSIPEMVYVECMIQHTPFSSERGVKIHQKDKGEFLSAVPAHYCLDAEMNPLPEGVPQKGEEVPGYLRAKLIRNGGEEALLVLPPDNAQVLVSSGQVLRERPREPDYVPLGS